MNVTKSESEIRVRDLTMQLEIANAQKSEFEEEVKHLQQEIQVLNIASVTLVPEIHVINNFNVELNLHFIHDDSAPSHNMNI